MDGIHYIPSFIDTQNENNDNISFSALSSGEQIIVSLILWAYNQKLGEQNKVLLLDEFDAHLNPSMSKMLIEVIKEKLVKEFDIQVIMTTHSPSTVAHTSDDDLFWMTRGENIRKSSKKEIIPILSDGIITVDEDSASLSIDYKMNLPGNSVLFVEGISDKIILEAAWKKLFPLEKMPFNIVDAFDCYFIINIFLRENKNIFSNYQDKLFIGLLDFDEAYKNWKEKSKEKYIKSSLENYIFFKNKKYPGYILPLPIPQYRDNYAGENMDNSYLTIELLFRDEIIKEYCDERTVFGGAKLLKFKEDKKTDFAKKTNDMPPEEFENFRQLFKIITLISKSAKEKIFTFS